MVKANNTIFQFYLAMMDFFGDFLSKKYLQNSYIEDTKHYQTNIIMKIVRMFHSLDLLAKNTLDEVSAKCVLRGVLDSVTTYRFIYLRTDVDDILFRHYLYALDGWREYKKSVIPILEENEYKYKEDSICDNVINQIEEKLRKHIYYSQDQTAAKLLIQNANWKYESIQNLRSLKYGEMYLAVGFDKRSVDYFQGYLSQFVHGLSLSNKPIADSEQMNRALCECVPIADRFIQSIYQTFHDKELTENFFRSNIIQKLMDSIDFSSDVFSEFTLALVRKDNTFLI